MDEQIDSCGQCRFFSKGTCCKSPPLGHAFLVPSADALGTPRMDVKTISYFPIVRPEQWCGSFEQKPARLSA